MIGRIANAWRRLSLLRRIFLFIVILYIAIAIAAPALMPYSVEDFSHPALEAPSETYPLGTDEMGHDILSLLLNGFRSTVFLALAAGALSTLFGTVLAFFSVYIGRGFDRVTDFLTNLLLIVPDMIIILVVATIARPNALTTLLIIIFFSWARVYKNTRSKLKDLMSDNRVLYLLSMKGNALDLLKVLWADLWPVSAYYFVIQTNRALMYETTLSFFGIGDPLSKTWGKLIHAAMNYTDLYYDNVYQWYLLPVVLVLVLFVISLALLVSEVSDA